MLRVVVFAHAILYNGKKEKANKEYGMGYASTPAFPSWVVTCTNWIAWADDVISLYSNSIWEFDSSSNVGIAAIFVISPMATSKVLFQKNESYLSRNILSNQQELFLKSLTASRRTTVTVTTTNETTSSWTKVWLVSKNMQRGRGEPCLERSLWLISSLAYVNAHPSTTWAWQ
ncbi:MAG TPA: hypothetical protein VF172_13605 [Nitrososphaera sp.]